MEADGGIPQGDNHRQAAMVVLRPKADNLQADSPQVGDKFPVLLPQGQGDGLPLPADNHPQEDMVDRPQGPHLPDGDKVRQDSRPQEDMVDRHNLQADSPRVGGRSPGRLPLVPEDGDHLPADSHPRQDTVDRSQGGHLPDGDKHLVGNPPEALMADRLDTWVSPPVEDTLLKVIPPAMGKEPPEDPRGRGLRPTRLAMHGLESRPTLGTCSAASWSQ